MRHLIVLIIESIVSISCYSQNRIIFKEKQSDVFVIDNRDDFNLSENDYNKLTIKEGQHLVFFQEWRGYGGGNFNKEYTFYKGNDTMVVKCFCGQAYNAYIKNFTFKRGTFELKNNSKGIKIIKGSDIASNSTLQKVVIKNVKLRSTKSEFVDLEFKDILFEIIDLSDTTNFNLEVLK